MIGIIDAARYLISLDTIGNYFNKKLVSLNGCDFYEGNARLNKILHLAQNIYIGRTGAKLIDTNFYAYDNGGVALEVQEDYAFLLGTKASASYALNEEEKDFLYRVFTMLKDAPIDELISIDHEDPAWKEKHGFYLKKDQIMDSMKYADEYKDRYEAANFYLDRMAV